VPNELEVNLPYRWDLVTPEQLGTLMPADAEPDVWFLDELVECAAKVVARGGNGDLFFVGRSLDSMYDLLCGAFEDTVDAPRLERLPLSFALRMIKVDGGRRSERLTYPHVLRARYVLKDLGLSPYHLARRHRPVTFVDVVHGGGTFTELYTIIRGWIAAEREPWPVIRQKLRFVGVTARGDSGPKQWRWQQHTEWTAELPARAVRNVALRYGVWSYLADTQPKLTRTFPVADWFSDCAGPRRGETLGPALAQAIAIVGKGRDRDVRRSLARAMASEPAMAQRWLRSLVVQLTAR
jgi:hypothetical protein